MSFSLVFNEEIISNYYEFKIIKEELKLYNDNNDNKHNNIKPSKVFDTETNTTYIDNNVRSSKEGNYINGIFDFDWDVNSKNKINEFFETNFNIYSYSFYDAINSKVNTFSFNNQDKLYNYKTLCYIKDDHFIKHIDNKKNNSHIGTIIILPPLTYSKFEGGELVVYKEDGETIENIYLPEEKQWKLIFIKHNTVHEVKKIISGIRITFTTPFELDSFYTNLLLSNNKCYNTIFNINLTNNIEANRDKLLVETIVNSPRYQSEYEDFSKKTFVIILKYFYEHHKLENIEKYMDLYDKITYNNIIEYFKGDCNISFINENLKLEKNAYIKLNKCDYYFDDDEFDLDYNSKFYNKGILCITDNLEESPGLIGNTYSRYNDTTYNIIESKWVTLMVVKTNKNIDNYC